MLHKRIVYTILLLFCANTITAQNIYTCFGNGTIGSGGDGGPASTAQFSEPVAIAEDAVGNLYIGDCGAGGHRIRKINRSGIISTIAGTGIIGSSGDGGPATNAELNSPVGLSFDNNGNLYIADVNESRIRKIDTNGIITTIAGTGVIGYSGDYGPATNAQIYGSQEVIADNRTGCIYFCDTYNNIVRKINPLGIITTIAGILTPGYSGDGGPATLAKLYGPSGLVFDVWGNLYICDFYNHRIRKVDTAGTITTFAGIGGIGGTGGYSGDGIPATDARLNRPCSIIIDDTGNFYFSDQYNQRIRKISTSGIITTVAGTGIATYSGDGGPATSGAINFAKGLFVTNRCSKNLLIADQINHRVRVISSNYNPPVFSEGHTQSLDACRDSTTAINSLLTVIETDVNQELTWSVLQPPANGTLLADYSTISTGGAVSPMGLTYTPTTGYVGADSFRVQLYDCTYMYDTTTIYVTVAPCALKAVNKFSVAKALTIAPNPSNGLFTISLPTSGNEMNAIIIRNVTGEKIQELTTTENVLSLQLALPKGIYLLTAQNLHYCENARLIIGE